MQQDTLKLLDDVTKGMTRVASLVRQDGDDALKSGDHIQVIKHWAHLRIAMDRVKEAREALEEMADILKEHTIPEMARDLKERTGVKPPFRIEGVGTVSIRDKIFCSIKDDPELGKEPGYDWLRANEAGSLIKPTVNAATLSAYAGDLIKNHGKDLPDDVFTVTIKFTTALIKSGA